MAVECVFAGTGSPTCAATKVSISYSAMRYTGFVNSKLVVDSREVYGVDLIGPTRRDNAWQAKDEAGFAARDFVMDWEREQAMCPAGKVSNSWTPAIDRFKNEVIKIKFAMADCRTCSVRAQCTRSARPRRTFTIRPQAQHEVLQASRQREATENFVKEYARRAGVEGTIARECAPASFVARATGGWRRRISGI